MLSNKGRHKTTKLGSNVVQELKINQRRILIDSLEIGIPAPQQMIALGERQLPNGVKVGQLLNSKTLNYKKFTPHRDGLFCERIFGPVQSFVCACGKKKESVQSKSRQKGIVKAEFLPSPTGIGVSEVTPLLQTEPLFCPKCQVEYISKNVRRHRLGHIKLFAPVTHIWYLKGRPSYLSLFLGKRKKVITSLAYCNAYLVEQVYSDLEPQNLSKDTDKFVSTLLGKSNVKIWENPNLPCKELENKSIAFVTGNDQSEQDKKEKPVKNIGSFLSPSLRGEPRAMQRGITKQSFVRTDKQASRLKDSPTSTNSGSEHFFSLLVQLFPETFTQKLAMSGKNEVVQKQSFYKILPEQCSGLKSLLKQGVQRSDLVGKRLKYKISTRLEAIKYLSETAFRVSVERGVMALRCKTGSFAQRSFCKTASLQQSFQRKPKSFVGVANQQASKVGEGEAFTQSFVMRTAYIRAQSLPFLPSFICPFQLRDRLISFLQSLPCEEDIPIPLYCQTPRRYPLRDVHKFLAELRYTNSTNQPESLSNESITKFKGLSKQARSLIASYPEGVNASFLRENQVLQKRSYAKNFDFATQTGTCTNSKAVSKPSVLQTQQENKSFGFVTDKKLENESFAFSTDKAAPFWRAGVKAPTGEYLILSTNTGVDATKRFQQQSDQLLRKQYKKGGFPEQPKTKHLTETKQSFVTSFAQTLKKQALLPPGLSFVRGSSLVRNRSLSLAKTSFLQVGEGKAFTQSKHSEALYCNLVLQKVKAMPFTEREPFTNLSKKDISESLVLNKAHSTNEFLYPEQNLSDLSTQAQLLPRETRTSLKGILLNTFLDIILTGLVVGEGEAFTDLSLPAAIKRFQTNGIKQGVSRGQHKQTTRHLNLQTGLALRCVAKPKVLHTQGFAHPMFRFHRASGFATQRKTKAFNKTKGFVKLLLRQSKNQDMLNNDLQDLLFENKIDTYQARLLHIVFGILPQLCTPKVLQAQRSFYKTKLNSIGASVKAKPFTERKAFINQNKGFSKFGCTYLLSKYQQEPKQDFAKTRLCKKVEPVTKASLLYLPFRFHRALGFATHNAAITKPKLLLALCVALFKPEQGNQVLGFVTQPKFGLLGKLDRASFFEQISKVEDRKKLKAGARTKLNHDRVKEFTDSSLAKNENTLVEAKQSKALLSFTKTETFVGQKKVSAGRSFVTPTVSDSEAISKWHTSGAKEILLYTGGGALESLLKRFNTSLFCQFLLGEIQILRKHYKDQIVCEYNQNQTTKKHGFDSSVRDELGNRYNQDLYLEKSKIDLASAPKFSEGEDSNQVISYRNFAQIITQTNHNLELKSLATDKNTNLFCRRIYRTTRRLKIVQLLMRSKRRPEWMMISVLPVLPPDLRPVLQMGDNLIVASDLNTLYQRVIYRNNRHYKGRFLDFHFVSSIHRLVQDAVDRLIENGKSGSTPFLTPGGRPLKSLSDILKGKRGRFRFNLLGKRVDFSGRSVIVVSPNLKIHECGLPREMALELYKYLLIRQLLLQKRVSSIVNAKKLIKQRKPFIWDILREIIYYHPLLLNRAPTLHRLGIQAFQPKLALGNAILLHPLVCAGFNADFDGDQMGVHLPLSPQARAEAWELLWSRNNLLSPATGQPILLPSQDMVLGFYYMTSLLPYGTTNKAFLPLNFAKRELCLRTLQNRRLTNSFAVSKPSVLQASKQGVLKERDKNKTDLVGASSFYKNEVVQNFRFCNARPVVHMFSDQFQVIYAYQKKQIDIHTPIWLKWAGKSENGEKNQAPLEIRINIFGHRTQIYSTHQFKSETCLAKRFHFALQNVTSTNSRAVSKPSFLCNRIPLLNKTEGFVTGSASQKVRFNSEATSNGIDSSLFVFHIRTTAGRVLVNNLISKHR